MLKTLLSVGVAALIAVAAASLAVDYNEEDIAAYHFHTYFFLGNSRDEAEAMSFRRALRSKIQDGFLSACSLNRVDTGRIGPHPYSQWEMCCNKTSFPQATAFHMKNHGNLSVLIHPLTLEDRDDHVTKIAWMGKPVPLDAETGLFDILPEPRRCPVYPDYPDEISHEGNIFYEPVPGTEDLAYQASSYYKLNLTES